MRPCMRTGCACGITATRMRHHSHIAEQLKTVFSLPPPLSLSLSPPQHTHSWHRWRRLKTTDTTPRVIFLPRYADLLLTQPLLLATIGLMSKADTSVLVSLVG